ncbi:hypothetical protein D3C71_2153200 [compost metagenome]
MLAFAKMFDQGVRGEAVVAEHSLADCDLAVDTADLRLARGHVLGQRLEEFTHQIRGPSQRLERIVSGGLLTQ